jgi:hypothetical protein
MIAMMPRSSRPPPVIASRMYRGCHERSDAPNSSNVRASGTAIAGGRHLNLLSGGQNSCHFGLTDGPTEAIALYTITCQLSGGLQMLRRFDALCDDSKAPFVRLSDDSTQKTAGGRGVLYQGSVDFYLGHRQDLNVGERFVSHSEVVH